MKTLIKSLILSSLLFTSCSKTAVKEDLSGKKDTPLKNAVNPGPLAICDPESFYFFEDGPTENPPNSFGVQINSANWASAIVSVTEYGTTNTNTYSLTGPSNAITTIASGINALKTYNVQLQLTCSDGTVTTSAIRHDQIKSYDVGPDASYNTTFVYTSSPRKITITNHFPFTLYVGVYNATNNTSLVGATAVAPGASFNYSPSAAGRYGVLFNKFDPFTGFAAYTRLITLS
jgi:hypothetical protein